MGEGAGGFGLDGFDVVKDLGGGFDFVLEEKLAGIGHGYAVAIFPVKGEFASEVLFGAVDFFFG